MSIKITIVGNMERVASSTDHNKLGNRDIPEQHPIEAIINLRSTLDDIDSYMSTVSDDILIIQNHISAGPVIPVTSTTIEYENCVYRVGEKREKRRVITGDINRTISYTYDNLDRVILESVLENSITKTKTIEYSEASDTDLISTVVDQGTDILSIHRLEVTSKKTFEVSGQLEYICNHSLNTKHLSVTIWVNNIVYNNYTSIEAIDLNNIKVITPVPITGVIVIS